MEGRTGAEVKAIFAAHGQSIAGWARSNGYRPSDVYQVLDGRAKGRRGRSHEIAAKLGMKPPPVEPLPNGFVKKGQGDG